jgi:TolB protein
MNADGSEVTRLTNNSGFALNPSWSPDGKKIAFTSGGESFTNPSEIYVMNADGSEQERLTDNRVLGTEPSWSPFLSSEE